jgi:hypothetical protein
MKVKASARGAVQLNMNALCTLLAAAVNAPSPVQARVRYGRAAVLARGLQTPDALGLLHAAQVALAAWGVL